VAAGGLQSNSLAAASGPLHAACEEALEGCPDAHWHAAGIAWCRAGGIDALSVERQEACGADNASSLISMPTMRMN